jgi:PAS domain S-box-containing protein
MKVFLKRVRLSLKMKLTLLIESLVLVLLLVTGIITTMNEKKHLEGELKKRGVALAKNLANFTERPLLNNDLPTLRRFVNHSLEQDYVLYVSILDFQGKVLMHSDLSEVDKTYRNDMYSNVRDLKEPGCSSPHLSEDGERHCDIFAPIEISGEVLGMVMLGYSYAALEKEIIKNKQQVLSIGFGATIIGGIVAYLLAAFISSPIKRITDAIEHVAKGDLNMRLTIKRDDEIGSLADAFNNMTEDLRKTTISKDYVDNIISSMNDTLVVVDPDTKIVSVNRATCELLGYKEDELIGSDINLIVPQIEIFRDQKLLKLPGEVPVENRELYYVTKSGKHIPMLFSAAVLKNKEGGIDGSVGIARDVTELKQAEKALQKSEQQLHLLSSQLIKTQEIERRRVSRELHDELGQALMVFKIKLRYIREKLGIHQAALKANCDEVISIINDTTQNVRQLSRALSPAILEDLGLSAALRWLVNISTEHTDIKSSLDMEELVDLFSQEAQITIYRIIQESLTNVVKHAQARHVSVAIIKHDDKVEFRVEDDGKGFDVKEVLSRAPHKKGLGLVAMYERTRMLGGSLNVWSQRGSGTKITFTVPIDYGDAQ